MDDLTAGTDAATHMAAPLSSEKDRALDAARDDVCGQHRLPPWAMKIPALRWLSGTGERPRSAH